MARCQKRDEIDLTHYLSSELTSCKMFGDYCACQPVLMSASALDTLDFFEVELHRQIGILP